MNEQDINERRLEQKLQQIFEKYGVDQDTSKLKSEVFKSLDTFKLIGNIFSLYTTELTVTELKFLNSILEERKKK